MSATPRNRAYRVMNYLPVDRLPDQEFGFWPQTLRKWVADGFPKAWADEIGDGCFHMHFERFIGTDAGEELEQTGGIPANMGINPKFERQILSSDEITNIVRDAEGVTARWYKPNSDEASIPEYIDWPVHNRDDWERLKDRYRADDPIRVPDPKVIAEARQRAADGWMVGGWCCGFYGQLRNWVGVENLSYLFYDDPDLVADMCNHWAELAAMQIRNLPDDLPVHYWNWWEDMCFNGGPLCSVEQFNTFIVPAYKHVLAEAKRRGATLSMVDSDGLIHALVPGWLDAGVNILFPNEVAAGTDMFWIRRTYGKAARLQGGIDKKALIAGKDAIDRELDRIEPLVRDGGFIPYLDHLVPPDVTLDNYMYYRQQKKKLIGKN